MAAGGMARGQMGVYEPGSCRFLACAMCAFACLAVYRGPWKERGIALAAGAGALAWYLHGGPIALLSVPLILSGSMGGGPIFPRIGVSMLLLHLAEVVGIEAVVDRVWPHWSGLISGGSRILGPTPMTAVVWEIGVILAIVCRPRGRAAAGVAAAHVALAVLQVFFQNPWFMATGVATIAYSVAPATDRESGALGAPQVLRAGIAASCLATLAGVAILQWPSLGEPRRGPVLLFRDGHYFLDPPVHGVYGKDRRQGAYGQWKQLLESAGYPFVAGEGSIPSDLADRCRLLVVLNPTRPFTSDEVNRVRTFVREGGSLLVMADHTNMWGAADHANALLEATGIRLNDDAVHMWARSPYWGTNLTWASHPSTWGVSTSDTLLTGIGCSLTVESPARPLLVFRSAFSDAADRSNEEGGFLGNRRLDSGERVGDLIVAAVGREGRGKVAVFGDTLTFQDRVISSTWPFVLRLVDDLMREDSGLPAWPGGIALILGAAGLCLWWSPGILVVLILALSALESVVEMRRAALAAEMISAVHFRGDVALIDFTHSPVVNTLRTKDPEGIGGLALNLARNGYLPLVVQQKELLERLLPQARLVVAPAAARPYRLTPSLESFFQRGGVFLATVGAPEGACLEEVLAETGLRLVRMPLGKGGEIRSLEENVRVRFTSAWPIAEEGGRVLPILLAWGYPVAGFVPRGAGGLLLIGDSSFFSDRNLEGDEAWVPENVEFFRLLCRFIREGA